MKKLITLFLAILMIAVLLTACGEVSASSGYNTKSDIQNQQAVADSLSRSQKTPTDIDYSLERFNLIRRAYWVNGQEEKANTLVCPVQRPLGYVLLMTESGAVVQSFAVDGKVSSLNSYLTPSCVDEVYGHHDEAGYTTLTTEMADVDGSYGENDSGIFFFTPEGIYYEWTGLYLYSSHPFIVENPVVKVGAVE